MPTIKQLPLANTVGASDLLPVSQGGATRGLAIGNLLSSVQPAIALAQGNLLGRVSAFAGGPEAVGIGVGLGLSGGSVAATGGDHVQFPVSPGLSPGDEVVVNSGGVAKRMAAGLLRGLFGAGPGVTIDASGTLGVDGSVVTLRSALGSGAVVATGSTAARSLADRSSDRLSVRDFGAVCDGVTDDSVAMAAAATALRGTGKTLYIPGNCRVLLGGAAQVWLSGIRIAGDGVRELGVPGPGIYGAQGSTILIGSALAGSAASPIVVSDDWHIEGINFNWVGQTEAAAVANGGVPVFYAPLISPHVTGGAGDQVRNWSFRNCQVENAYDVMDFTSAAGMGNYHFDGNLVFALRYVLRLRSVGGEGFIRDNQFSPAADVYGILGTSTTHLRDFSTLTAEVLRVEGNGTATTVASTAVEGQRFSGNYMLGVRYGLHVVGGGYNISTWSDNTFDQVPNVIAVESGGVMSLDVHGGRVLSQRLGDTSLVTTAFSVSGGAPGSHLSLNGVEVEYTVGHGVVFADPGPGSLSIIGGKLAAVGQAQDGGAYNGVSFDAPGGNLVVAGVAISSTNSVSEHAGAHGIVVLNAVASTVVGAVLGGWYFPYYNQAGTGQHSLTGSTSYGTAAAGGTTAISGPGVVVTAGNSWDVGPNAPAYAPLASPALTGVPTAPTAVAGTASGQVATTAFVAGAVASGVAVMGVIVTQGASYAMRVADRVVVVRKAVGSSTGVTLPASPVAWVPYVVKDGAGNAAANPITVSGGAIDGGSSYALTEAWESVTLVFDGAKWSVV